MLRYFIWVALQTLLKITSLQYISDILKGIVWKTNSKHGFYSPLSNFIFVYNNTTKIHERTKVKNTIRFCLKNTTLVYNYCQY